MRCDLCGSTGTASEPIVTRLYVWDGQEREVDLCALDIKEVTTMFEALMEKSRRPEGSRTRRSASSRKTPYSGDTRFNEWYNASTSMFECPGVDRRDGGEHKCTRQFTSANGLAVHHKRKHGANL